MLLLARMISPRALAVSGIAVITLALAGAALAQIHPDAKTGKVIAEKLCVGCHIVGAEAAGATVSSDVPSFEQIANVPDQTVKSIAGAIVIPHPPMPQIQLTREEIGDVAAYILSLKK
ncbi:Cytochrome c-552 [Hyphomicrobium sp. 1Nfss2.1]|uniref:c-type cytochrome n=1 Tax=Hyphomicrobium sp. 1Nfss2.1 TaxID=3413936 RepID=UPI003C7BAC51